MITSKNGQNASRNSAVRSLYHLRKRPFVLSPSVRTRKVTLSPCTVEKTAPSGKESARKCRQSPERREQIIGGRCSQLPPIANHLSPVFPLRLCVLGRRS